MLPQIAPITQMGIVSREKAQMGAKMEGKS